MQNFQIPGLSTMITINTLQANRALWNLGQNISLFQRQVAHVGMGLTFAVSLPMQVAIAATSKMFAELEDAAIRTTARVKDATKNTAKEIQSFVTSLSLKVPMSPLELEESVDQMIRMGKSLDFAKRASLDFGKFATVMGSDMREATDSVIKLLSIMGMVTGDVTKDLTSMHDMMNKIILVQERTGWSDRETFEAFQHGAAQAKQFGLNVKELAISLIMLRDAGKEGTDAGTSLALILGTLNRSHAIFKSTWADIFGADLANNWATMKAEDKFKAFKKGVERYSPAGQQEMFKSIAIEPRQMRQIMPFLDQTPRWAEIEKAVANTAALQERFDSTMKSMRNQLSLITNAFRMVGLAIGGIVLPPILLFLKTVVLLIKVVSTLVYWINQIPLIGPVLMFFTKAWVGIAIFGLAVVGPLILIVDWLIRMYKWVTLNSVIMLGYGKILKSVLLMPFSIAGWKSFFAIFSKGGVLGLAVAGLLQFANAFNLVRLKLSLTGTNKTWTGPTTWGGLGNALLFGMGRKGFNPNVARGPGLFGRARAGMTSGIDYASGKYSEMGGIGLGLDMFFGNMMYEAAMKRRPGMGQWGGRFAKSGFLGGREYSHPNVKMGGGFSTFLRGAGEGMIEGGFFRLTTGEVISKVRKKFGYLGFAIMNEVQHLAMRYSVAGFGGVLDTLLSQIAVKLDFKKFASKVNLFGFFRPFSFRHLEALIAVPFQAAFTKAGIALKSFWTLLTGLNFREIFAGMAAAAVRFGTAIKGLAVAGLARGAAGAGVAGGVAGTIGSSFMAIPVWGWLVAGVVAAGSALWYFSDKTKKLADGLLKATHPSLLSTPGGGYKFAPLGPEIERQLAGETPAWNDMRLPQYQKNIGGSAPQIYDRKEIMKWRDQINKQLEMGATPEEFSESLSGALAVHAILQEDFDNLTRYMEGQTRQSDFSGIIGGPGTEEYGEKKTAGPSHFFSAQTYGSAEEYRMRVTGQQSLVQATTGLLNEAKATKQATQETAKNTAAIKDSLAPSEPLNLKK